MLLIWQVQPATILANKSHSTRQKVVNNYVNYKLHGTVIIMERFSKSLTTAHRKQSNTSGTLNGKLVPVCSVQF